MCRISAVFFAESAVPLTLPPCRGNISVMVIHDKDKTKLQFIGQLQ